MSKIWLAFMGKPNLPNLLLRLSQRFSLIALTD
jgi:hypothetical protein